MATNPIHPAVRTRPMTRVAAMIAVLIASGATVSACASGGGSAGRENIMPANAQRLAAYTPAVRAGDLIFFSGQIGIRPDGGLAGNVREETEQALANLRNLMSQAGVAARDIVKCTVFMADIRDYGTMNEVYGAFFSPDPAPARSAVAVAGLPASARVEIECIALARS